MAVKERLKELMAQHKVSQAELARRLGENPNWVQRRLNPKPRNKSTIEADEVPRFAGALHVPITALFGNHSADLAAKETAVLADLGFDVTPLERDTLVEFAGALARYRKRLLDEEAS